MEWVSIILTCDMTYPSTNDIRRTWFQVYASLALTITNSIKSQVVGLINHGDFVEELLEYLKFLYYFIKLLHSLNADWRNFMLGFVPIKPLKPLFPITRILAYTCLLRIHKVETQNLQYVLSSVIFSSKRE